MKTCEHEGCTNPQFGGGRCKYHQYERKKLGGDLHVRKKPKPRTEKRAKDERYYSVVAKEFFEDSDKKCFFCGDKVDTFQGLHHFKGRTNDYLLDKRWWCVTHNSCHLDYHNISVDKTSKEKWYEGFLIRLKNMDEGLYNKQIGKSEKSSKYNPSLWDEEEDL
jgi:hypothetical protein